MQHQAAYNLEEFMPREAPQRRLRVAEPKKRASGFRPEILEWTKRLAAAAFFLALILSVLNARTSSMELTDQINSAKAQLTSLQSEYAYLTNEAEMKMNSSDVESYAKSLGLYAPEQSQIIYVEREEDDSITIPKTGLEQTIDKAAMGAMSLMEYLER